MSCFYGHRLYTIQNTCGLYTPDRTSCTASAVRIKLLGKDFKSAADDSIRRMKNPVYAEKYVSASTRDEFDNNMDAAYYGHDSEEPYEDNEDDEKK